MRSANDRARAGSRILIALLVASLILGAAGPACAQQEALDAIVGKIQASFSKVEAANFTYEQEVKRVSFSTLSYTYKQTDKKGVVTSFSSDFNLADIDGYTVREETQKDVIFVVVSAKNKQKMFRTVKNGKTEPYDDVLKIHARDVDHARAVSDLIKQAIPLGEKITEGKLKLTGYAQMKQWLIGHIGKVSDGSSTIEQQLKEETFPGSFRLLVVTSTAKAAEREEFLFNVADINLNALGFKITGNRLGVEFGMMEGLRSISSTRDGEARPFEDKVIIYSESVDDARDIRTVLTLMSPLAQAMVKADMPNATASGDILTKLASYVAEVKQGTTTFTQSMTTKCVCTLSVAQKTASSTVAHTYTFNWMDLNPNFCKLDVTSSKMSMEFLMMDKLKLIGHTKDGKPEGYQNEGSFLVDNMEVGRRARYLVEKAITACKSGYKDPFPADVTGTVTWLIGAVGDVQGDQTSIKQKLERVEAGNNNKIKFTRVEVKSNASAEEVFEFNLGDLFPGSVTYDVQGNFLTIKVETTFKNKIIKAYKAGKIQPYVSSLEFVVPDSEVARGLVAAFKQCAEKLKGK